MCQDETSEGNVHRETPRGADGDAQACVRRLQRKVTPTPSQERMNQKAEKRASLLCAGEPPRLPLGFSQQSPWRDTLKNGEITGASGEPVLGSSKLKQCDSVASVTRVVSSAEWLRVKHQPDACDRKQPPCSSQMEKKKKKKVHTMTFSIEAGHRRLSREAAGRTMSVKPEVCWTHSSTTNDASPLSLVEKKTKHNTHGGNMTEYGRFYFWLSA